MIGRAANPEVLAASTQASVELAQPTVPSEDEYDLDCGKPGSPHATFDGVPHLRP